AQGASQTPRGRTQPRRQHFSARNTRVRASIQTRFIKPTTNRTDINAQQQPRQYAPWARPARTAARVPPPKSCSMRKAKGLRQVRRQIVFQRLNLYKPAIVHVKPPSVC